MWKWFFLRGCSPSALNGQTLAPEKPYFFMITPVLTEPKVPFLEERNTHVLPPTPYSPDLSSCVFWLFLRYRGRIGRTFCIRDSLLIERRTRDRKVAGSNPGRSGGWIFFPGFNLVCWLLFGVRSTLVLPQWHLIDPLVVLPEVQVADYT